MRRDTVCRSMYSDISIRIMAFSSPNMASARDLHSSVLPTPVGPRNRNAADGTLGVLQTHTATADGPGHGLHGLVLAHHPLMKGILHVQQAAGPRPPSDGSRGYRSSQTPQRQCPPPLTGPVLLIVLAALVPLDLHLLLVVLLDVPQLGGLLISPGLGNGRVLVLGQGGDLLLQALELRGEISSVSIRTRLAASSIRSMALSGRNRSLIYRADSSTAASRCLVGDVQLVVLLILLPQALQDLQRGLLAGLAHLSPAGTGAPERRPFRYTCGTR